MDTKIVWPDNRKFAFSVVDDTDYATVNNVKSVYDYLYQKNIITTKSVWVYKPRDNFSGQTIQDEEYLKFIKEIQARGFEIAFHNSGSGAFKREETLEAFEIFKNLLGKYPTMHINHSNNIENIYWGHKRFLFPINLIYAITRINNKSFGEKESCEYFWGDFCKKNIKYIRNRTFNDINLLNVDPTMPNYEIGKRKYSNYWFSSCDAADVKSFSNLMSKENIDRLERENGLCIIYTHFANGFVNAQNVLDEGFKKPIDYLSQKNGWFVPATQILDFLLSQKQDEKKHRLGLFNTLKLDFRWFFERCSRKN